MKLFISSVYMLYLVCARATRNRSIEKLFATFCRQNVFALCAKCLGEFGGRVAMMWWNNRKISINAFPIGEYWTFSRSFITRKLFSLSQYLWYQIIVSILYLLLLESKLCVLHWQWCIFYWWFCVFNESSKQIVPNATPQFADLIKSAV